MADYYPLIARAVAGLEKNTGDSRRALYERARTALVAQLRGVTPALSESDITRERLALEEAIRKVEAESARQTWVEPARAEPVQKVRPPEMPKWEDLPLASGQGAERRTSAPPRTESLLRRTQTAPRQPDSPAPNTMFGSERYVDPVFDQPIPEGQPATPPPAAPEQRHPLRGRPPGERRSLLDSGVNDFRNLISEPNELGEAPARGARTARESYRESSPEREPAALEPQAADERLRDGVAPRLLEPAIDDETQQMPARVRMAPSAEEGESQRSSIGDYIKIAAALMIVAALAGSLLVLWPTLSQLYGALRVPTEVASDPATAPTGRVKNPERFEAGGQTTPQPAAVSPGAAVAQRVILYEEDPGGDPKGKRFVGSAIWRTETISPGPGLPPEIAIRADVEIPERRIAMTWSLRRNTDTNMPASHTVEIVFKLPQDFNGGGVANIPGILMKQDEQTRGIPLSGLAVKVMNGFFLIGLNSNDADRDRNLGLLKERAWFDIPIQYNNNRRAILALEKGTPGERIFAEAFRVWRQ